MLKWIELLFDLVWGHWIWSCLDEFFSKYL